MAVHPLHGERHRMVVLLHHDFDLVQLLLVMMVWYELDSFNVTVAWLVERSIGYGLMPTQKCAKRGCSWNGGDYETWRHLSEGFD